MVKPEVLDTNSKGATCASDKDKNLRVLKVKNNSGTKITTKNGSESKQRAKVKPNLYKKPDFFQMQYLMIPGTLELSETSVTPTTQNGSTRLSENSDKDETDEEYDEYPVSTTGYTLPYEGD